MAGLAAKVPMLSKIGSLLSFGGAGTVVGLSIGSSSVKLVELKRAGKSWKLLHFGIVQLPEDAIVNREIINPIVVADSIRTLIGQLKLGTKQVCTSISGTSVIIKRMTVEAPNAKELQEQVYWEAEQYLPFDVSEVVMDFQVLSKTKDSRTEVMLVAAKRSSLESYISCVEDSGLKAKIVDTDFFAMQNLFEANYPVRPAEAVAIVDIGASALKMVIMHGGSPIFTKDAAMGGHNVTAEIQKHLNLSFNDAELLKTSPQGNGTPQEVSDLLQVMSENFATEIKRSLDFYNASSLGGPVSYILLSGGGAKMVGLSKIIEDITSLPTQVINPFNAISYDPEVFSQDYVNSIAPIATVPIGLALRAGAK